MRLIPVLILLVLAPALSPALSRAGTTSSFDAGPGASCAALPAAVDDAKDLNLSILDEATAARAFNEIASDKDIPFDFPEGCYAKAQKVAMVLEQDGIIVGKAFVEGSIFNDSKWGESFWTFHVAPVILVRHGNDVSPFIIDLFLSNQLLAYPDWLALVTANPDTTITKRYFTNRFVYGPTDLTANPQSYDPAMIQDMNTVLEQIQVRLNAVTN